jgi:D-aspartate ligase
MSPSFLRPLRTLSMRTESRHPVPVVLGGEHGMLPIVRSLALGGLRSIVASADPYDIAFYSRYCMRRVLLKELHTSNDRWNTSTLIDLSTSLGENPVLLWGSDEEVMFLNRNREELSNLFRFTLAEKALTYSLVDKVRFARLTLDYGLPVPCTQVFATRDDLFRNLSQITFPCIVKPAFGHDWNEPVVKVRYGTYKHALQRIVSPDELMAYIETLPPAGHGVVLQPYIDGSDEHLVSFHGYFNKPGHLLAGFVGRKIRVSPIHVGGSSYVETMENPTLFQLGIEICRRLAFEGIVKIDFKWDSLHDRYYLLEFNTRFTLWNHLGAFAGVNLPLLWYRDLIGDTLPTATRAIPGRRWLCVWQDLRAFPQYYRAGEWTVGSWLRSYFAPKVYHTFDWKDPLPLIIRLPRLLRRKYRMLRLKRMFSSERRSA